MGEKKKNLCLVIGAHTNSPPTFAFLSDNPPVTTRLPHYNGDQLKWRCPSGFLNLNLNIQDEEDWHYCQFDRWTINLS